MSANAVGRLTAAGNARVQVGNIFHENQYDYEYSVEVDVDVFGCVSFFHIDDEEEEEEAWNWVFLGSKAAGLGFC